MLSVRISCKLFALHFTTPLVSTNNFRSIFSTKLPYLTTINFPRLYAECSTSTAVLDPIIVSNDSLNQDSFTVSYLINSCGLSPETAIYTSERVHLKTLENPESVLNLLKNIGFSKTQIAKVVRKRPRLLLANPEKTLLPKFQFLQSMGISNTDIAKVLSTEPTFLIRSMENYIIPCYNFLKSVLQSDEKIIYCMKRAPWVFVEDYTKKLIPNVRFLREFGMKESCIVLLLTHFPEVVMRRPEDFRSTVVEVSELGFDPLKSTFVFALHVLSGDSNKSIRDRCYKAYKKWGWSEDEIILAFRKHPNCMIMSEKKLSRSMDFLVNKMGFPSREIASYPLVLCFSFEKRIMPRCCVYQVLSLKGLIKKDLSLTRLLIHEEKYFLEKFVTKYEDKVPQLLDVYQGKADPLELM
ncbi:hypothetical protein LguiA_011409 [Lonicera macranthoides]